MAARGHIPSSFEGHSIQTSGMLRRDPFSGLGRAVHRPLEPLPPPEFFERKIAAQAAEIERIARENHRLAETHVVLRQELGATKQEMKSLQTHVESMHTESDLKARELVEKIRKMEAEIHAGEMMRKELQEVHLEAQSLMAARHNQTNEIQLVSEELQKASGEVKKLPEMDSERGALRQEHQKLRAAFEYEKNLNMDQVERMKATEKNLISLARELEKLRAEVAKAEKGASVPNTYGSPDPVYLHAGQGSRYKDRGYSQCIGYGDAGYGYASGHAEAGYSGAYGRPQGQMITGAAADGIHFDSGVGGAGYQDGYGRSQAQVTTGIALGEGMMSYGANSIGHYDATRGA